MNNKEHIFNFIKNIKIINNNIYKIENNIVKKGLTVTQYETLVCLNSKGKMCIKELINRQLSTPGNMTVVIKNLEKKKLITRSLSDDDKRFYEISLTEKGKKFLEKINPDIKKEVYQYINTIDDKEKEIINQLLVKLRKEDKDEI